MLQLGLPSIFQPRLTLAPSRCFLWTLMCIDALPPSRRANHEHFLTAATWNMLHILSHTRLQKKVPCSPSFVFVRTLPFPNFPEQKRLSSFFFILSCSMRSFIFSSPPSHLFSVGNLWSGGEGLTCWSNRTTAELWARFCWNFPRLEDTSIHDGGFGNPCYSCSSSIVRMCIW